MITTLRHVAFGGLLVVCAAETVHAGGGQAQGRWTSPALGGMTPFAADAPRAPFRRLFQPGGGPGAVMGRLQSAPPRPRVRCGTTLVPVDPRFDAGLRRTPPDRPRPSSRSVTPPACER